MLVSLTNISAAPGLFSQISLKNGKIHFDGKQFEKLTIPKGQALLFMIVTIDITNFNISNELLKFVTKKITDYYNISRTIGIGYGRDRLSIKF